MLKRIVFFVFVLMMSLNANAQSTVDGKLTKYFHARYHDLSNNPVNGLAIYQKFEEQLLASGKLMDRSQESYAMLMSNLLNDDVVIPILDWNLMDPDFAILSMPSNLATSFLYFSDLYANESLPLNSSASTMRPFVKRIMSNYNIGNKGLNVQLINSVNPDDFSKMIYKAPILALVYAVASYKEEMNQFTSRY